MTFKVYIYYMGALKIHLLSLISFDVVGLSPHLSHNEVIKKFLEEGTNLAMAEIFG